MTWPATPSGLRVGPEAGVLELVGPARVVEEVAATSGTSTSRDSRIGLPLSSDSSTASSRARSCMMRAMRNRYLPRSRAGSFGPDRVVGPARGRDRAVDVGRAGLG